MAAFDLKDHTGAWEEWDALLRRRDTDPDSVMSEFLRERGWIVERPETIALPVQVASSGGFTDKDGYRLKLHVRVRIGDRNYQVDSDVNVRNADMAVRALIGPVVTKFQRAIMQELEPQIAIGFERELASAKRRVDTDEL